QDKVLAMLRFPVCPHPPVTVFHSTHPFFTIHQSDSPLRSMRPASSRASAVPQRSQTVLSALRLEARRRFAGSSHSPHLGQCAPLCRLFPNQPRLFLISSSEATRWHVSAPKATLSDPPVSQEARTFPASSTPRQTPWVPGFGAWTSSIQSKTIRQPFGNLSLKFFSSSLVGNRLV